MKRVAGAVGAVLFGLATVAAAQGAPPVDGPAYGVDKQHVRVMNQLERTQYEMRRFQARMVEKEAHPAIRDIGRALEETCGRLGVVEERMDRLSQAPALLRIRERLESLAQARERFRAMIAEVEEAHRVLRRTVERKAKMGEPMTVEEHERHELNRREREERMGALTARLQTLRDRMKGTADPMELEDLAMDLEKIRDRVQVMMTSCGAVHDDPDLSRDRDRLRVMDSLHDRMDALIALMEEARAGVDRAAGS